MKKRESHKYQGVGLKIKMLYMKRILFFQAIQKDQIKMLNIPLCCTVVNKEFSKEVDLDAEEGRSSLPPCLVFSSIVSPERLILQCANFAQI